MVLCGQSANTSHNLNCDSFGRYNVGTIILLLYIKRLFKKKKPLERLFLAQSWAGILFALWWTSGAPTILASELFYGYWVSVISSLILYLDAYTQLKIEKG